MSNNLENLLNILHVEELDTGLFRGITPPGRNRRVYGGQVLAQAINAATRTVDPARQLHSQHAYFLRPGDPARPIIYAVDPIRDGRNFSTRNVIARQGGKAIFNTSLSFEVPEKGLEHQEPMPVVPAPEDLESEYAFRKRMAELHPERYRVRESYPIDYRPLEFIDWVAPQPRPPAFGVWMRADGRMNDEAGMHRAMLAYMSDSFLMSTALLPHGHNYDSPHLQTASIDHGLWFYASFRADEWLYYAIESSRSGGGRGFNVGRIYTRSGCLVATAVQEGLMRFSSAAE